MDCVSEEVIKKEVVKTWVLVKCCFDVAQESDKNFEDHISGNLKVSNTMRIKLPAPNNTASPPHESDASVVKVPPELLGSLPEQHEALRV